MHQATRPHLPVKTKSLQPSSTLCLAVLSCSVVSSSLWPHGLACQAPLSMGFLQARILEWVTTPSFKGIFTIQGLNPGLPLCGRILYCPEPPGRPKHTVTLTAEPPMKTCVLLLPNPYYCPLDTLYCRTSKCSSMLTSAPSSPPPS